MILYQIDKQKDSLCVYASTSPVFENRVFFCQMNEISMELLQASFVRSMAMSNLWSFALSRLMEITTFQIHSTVNNETSYDHRCPLIPVNKEYWSVTDQDMLDRWAELEFKYPSKIEMDKVYIGRPMISTHESEPDHIISTFSRSFVMGVDRILQSMGCFVDGVAKYLLEFHVVRFVLTLAFISAIVIQTILSTQGRGIYMFYVMTVPPFSMQLIDMVKYVGYFISSMCLMGILPIRLRYRILQWIHPRYQRIEPYLPTSVARTLYFKSAFTYLFLIWVAVFSVHVHTDTALWVMVATLIIFLGLLWVFIRKGYKYDQWSEIDWFLHWPLSVIRRCLIWWIWRGVETAHQNELYNAVPPLPRELCVVVSEYGL